MLNLLVVGVTVELETMFVYDVTEQEDVEDEQEWGMHRTLGDAFIQRKGGGQLLVERCDWSHEGAVLVMVRWDSRQGRRMVWILVSKAIVRLSRVRILRRPESVEREDFFFDFEESCFNAVL